MATGDKTTTVTTGRPTSWSVDIGARVFARLGGLSGSPGVQVIPGLACEVPFGVVRYKVLGISLFSVALSEILCSSR